MLHTKEEAPPLTNTWVFVGFANRLNHGAIQSIKLMGRDLVLWRTQSGKISLINAYCPHMGTHLGSGKVRDEVIECPFHKKSFTSEGKCLGYGKPTQVYPLSEHNNMIFAWFGLTPPTWQMRNLLLGFPDNPDSEWIIYKSRQFNFNFHSKGMAENGVDASHFKIYHRFCESFEAPTILEKTDHTFISKLQFSGYPTLRKLNIPHKIEIVSENFGPCTLVINTTVKLSRQNFYFKFFYLSSPVINNNTNFTLVMTIKNAPKKKFSLLRKLFENMYFSSIFFAQWREFKRESKQIWEPKSFLSEPDFSPNENAMKEFHAWYSQFYDCIS